MVAIPHWLFAFLLIQMYPFCPHAKKLSQQKSTHVSLTSSPAVLDQPISLSTARVYTPASSQNSVIQLSAAAVGFIVNSAAVKLERTLTGVNGYRSGSVVNGLL
jgi:hypothetical protein